MDNTDTTLAKVNWPQTPTQASSWSLMDLVLTMDFQAMNSYRNARGLLYSRKIPSLMRHYRIRRLMKSKVTLSRSRDRHGTEEPLRTLVMLNTGSSRPSNGEVQLNSTYWWSFGNCVVVNVQMKMVSNAHTGEKLAESTLLLAMVIQWGSSYVTSEEHTPQYKHYMRKYFESLKQTLPRVNWQLNHHAALHIDSFLSRYGPLYGWWMFPFKRIICCLQKNTNKPQIRLVPYNTCVAVVLPVRQGNLKRRCWWY